MKLHSVAALALFVSSIAVGQSTQPSTRRAFDAEKRTVVSEGVVAAPIDEVWRVFSTDEGFKKLGIAKARVDLRPGGMIWSSYDPAAELGSENSIGTEILAVDPGHSLATHIKHPPKGFPFTESYQSVATMIHLTDLGDGRTHVRLAMSGFTDAEQSQAMREFFRTGNAWVMQKLQASFGQGNQPQRPAHSEGPLDDLDFSQLVRAPRDEVYRAFTTREGWNAFFHGVDSKIGALPGEPMEIYFDGEAPVGSRGSEGCKILSIIPNELFSFTWNAPPSTPVAREHHTWVVVEFQDLSPNLTRVHLRHLGFAQAAATSPGNEPQFEAARKHFVQGWQAVLSSLAQRLDHVAT